jgi:hypothetical protein
MTIGDIFNVSRARGVRIAISGNELRAQGRKGAVNDALRHGLTEHRQAIIEAYGDGIWPDESLPDLIVIPASTPNTVEAIGACIAPQRAEAEAA